MPHKLVLPAYCAIAGVDVVLAAVKGGRRARWLTKPLLMPLLAAHVANTDEPGDPQRLVLAGLALSGLGDIALLGEGDGPFTVGLVSFLAAHACYLAAFAKHGRGGARKKPWVAGAYGVAWAGLNLVLFPRTGQLRLPVLVYGSALAAMAVAALDTDTPTVAAGGALFLMSDSILALDTFGVANMPGADALVMLTYTAAQALIALGVVSSR